MAQKRSLEAKVRRTLRAIWLLVADLFFESFWRLYVCFEIKSLVIGRDVIRLSGMSNDAVTGWIDQLADKNQQAAEQLWQHVAVRLQEFAAQKLDVQTRRHYDEQDAANSAFHSLCHGLADGRLEASNRDALWGLLAVITSRKISAQKRYLSRQKRGGGEVRGESAFVELGGVGINQVDGKQLPPDELAVVSESCVQLLDALPDEALKKIVLFKFQGATNAEVAEELKCTERTVERKLERIRRIWIEAGLHDGKQ